MGTALPVRAGSALNLQTDIFHGVEDQPFPVFNVLANDEITSDPVTVRLVSNSTFNSGMVTLNPDNTINFTARPNFFGTDLFAYQVVDDRGAVATAYVLVDIEPVNDPPVFVTDLPDMVVEEGSLLTFTLLASDPDTGATDVLTYSLMGDLPPSASWNSQTKTFVWMPKDHETNRDYNLFVSVSDNAVPPATITKTIKLRAQFSYPDDTTPRAYISMTTDGSEVGNDLGAFESPFPGEAPLQFVSYSVTKTLSNTVNLMLGAQDNNEMAQVYFYVDGRQLLAVENYGAIGWDTRKEINGPHTLRVQAVDRALNITTLDVMVNVQNSLSLGRATPFPPNNSVVNGTTTRELVASFTGATIDPIKLNQNNGLQNAISGTYTKDGKTTPLIGEVMYDSSKNAVRFVGDIPQNAVVEWAVNVPDTAGSYMGGIFKFKNLISKNVGSSIKSIDGRLTVEIPPNSLPDDVFISIETPQSAVSPSATDGIVVAGPYEVVATNVDQTRVRALNTPAILTFYDPINPAADGYARQIQDCSDNGVCVPLDAFGAASEQGTTLSFPIKQLSTYRIVQFVIKGLGLADVYNMPNPLSPKEGGTKFRYLLSEDSHVEIVIYDLFGNLVRKLDTEAGAPGGRSGENFYSWDGKNGSGNDVANGGYVAKISAKGISGHESKATRKVLVVK
jgi:hypothetical protein